MVEDDCSFIDSFNEYFFEGPTLCLVLFYTLGYSREYNGRGSDNHESSSLRGETDIKQALMQYHVDVESEI